MLRANVFRALFTATYGSPNTQKWHKKDTNVDFNKQSFL